MPKVTYTAAEKKAFAKRMAKARKTRVSGSGKYTLGRTYTRGRGKYSVPRSFFNAESTGQLIGSGTGAALGNMIAPGVGGEIGSAIGKGLGGVAGRLFKSVTGFGSYQVKENSLLYGDRIVPSFGEDSIRVRKREYIAEVNATTAFSNTSFPIQPGLNDTFPWLSAIANNYEQYRFNGLIFQFVSTSSDAIASTTNLGLGQVILATDYNAADEPYVNLPQMLGAMFSTSAKPSENILHAIECAPTDQAQKLYYVRSGDVPTGTDIRLYDMGNFQIATENMQSNYTGMGQLWVTYDITFCKSVQNNQLGFDINTDSYFLTGVAVATPLGSARTLAEHSNLGTTVTNTVLSFPPTLSSGYYMIVWGAVGGADPVLQPTQTAANCTFIAAFEGLAATALTNSGETSANFINVRVVRIDGRDATITYSANGLFPSAADGDLIITQINGEIYL